ncbi:hypothetical protein TIFTF001_037356 [Ficus carica]|uniref:Uncharacterized protein n=1 Tax=Ficus carica TaxID=3494 RepID=A0AA88E554_FICCA|nr:hypothetical protein TIFTF001_037356 [Ficus carica]
MESNDCDAAFAPSVDGTNPMERILRHARRSSLLRSSFAVLVTVEALVASPCQNFSISGDRAPSSIFDLVTAESASRFHDAGERVENAESSSRSRDGGELVAISVSSGITTAAEGNVAISPSVRSRDGSEGVIVAIWIQLFSPATWVCGGGPDEFWDLDGLLFGFP